MKHGLILAAALLLLLGAGCRSRSPLANETACPSIFMPVCASNGKTYNNECEARKDGQIRTTQGECPSASFVPAN